MSIDWSIDISGPCVPVLFVLASAVKPSRGEEGKGNEEEANRVGVIFSRLFRGGFLSLLFLSFFFSFFFLLLREVLMEECHCWTLAFCGSGLRQQSWYLFQYLPMIPCRIAKIKYRYRLVTDSFMSEFLSCPEESLSKGMI